MTRGRQSAGCIVQYVARPDTAVYDGVSLLIFFDNNNNGAAG